MQYSWEDKLPFRKIPKVNEVSLKIGTFWMVRYLALEFGNQVIGTVLPLSSYIVIYMFIMSGFYNRWT
jgi:hypothetical protein